MARSPREWRVGAARQAACSRFIACHPHSPPFFPPILLLPVSLAVVNRQSSEGGLPGTLSGGVVTASASGPSLLWQQL